MTNMISRAIAHISGFFKEFQVKRFVSVVLVGFLVLTTSVNADRSAQAVTKKVDQAIQRDTSDRPKTTGEWNREARKTEDDPGKRAQRIAKESAEAVKDFGSVYPDTAKRTAGDRD
ncbi:MULTISPECIES: hypothetical protein [Nostocales]|uniref:Uncharacterized protein n=3 Tax=Nostocales TaxID=1161 RepID=A0A0C1NLJ5_9CYAN|nr:hypothetical protein [Tolypothrix bouteillei]KAF3884331.1 hypothetical protein DA73_0400001655 [Tolypothrix bouteillei VB521301]